VDTLAARFVVELEVVRVEKLQEEIPGWAEPIWTAECARLAEVGLVPRRPGLRRVTLILLPDQREVKTPTSVERVDELMRMAGTNGVDAWIEVESLDYEGEAVRIRRDEIVGWFAAVYDDAIPEQRPQPQVAAAGGPLDLSQLPQRRGKG
jgi:hypothetical protein